MFKNWSSKSVFEERKLVAKKIKWKAQTKVFVISTEGKALLFWEKLVLSLMFFLLEN